MSPFSWNGHIAGWQSTVTGWTCEVLAQDIFVSLASCDRGIMEHFEKLSENKRSLFWCFITRRETESPQPSFQPHKLTAGLRFCHENVQNVQMCIIWRLWKNPIRTTKWLPKWRFSHCCDAVTGCSHMGAAATQTGRAWSMWSIPVFRSSLVRFSSGSSLLSGDTCRLSCQDCRSQLLPSEFVASGGADLQRKFGSLVRSSSGSAPERFCRPPAAVTPFTVFGSNFIQEKHFNPPEMKSDKHRREF